MILTLISLIVFAVYLFFMIKRYSIPKSLSDTYYLLGKTDDPKVFNRLRASIFTAMMWIISFTLLPVILEATPDNWKFLAYLALAGICFVGAAPEFKDPLEGKVHTTSAYVAAIFGILWSVIAVGAAGRIALGVSAFIVLAAALMTDSLKSSRTFWLEMIAFGTVYISCLFELLP